jgi:hypothetical protein
MCIILTFTTALVSFIYFSFASSDVDSAGFENVTSTNETSIVLVHDSGKNSRS